MTNTTAAAIKHASEGLKNARDAVSVAISQVVEVNNRPNRARAKAAVKLLEEEVRKADNLEIASDCALSQMLNEAKDLLLSSKSIIEGLVDVEVSGDPLDLNLPQAEADPPIEETVPDDARREEDAYAGAASINKTMADPALHAKGEARRMLQNSSNAGKLRFKLEVERVCELTAQAREYEEKMNSAAKGDDSYPVSWEEASRAQDAVHLVYDNRVRRMAAKAGGDTGTWLGEGGVHIWTFLRNFHSVLVDQIVEFNPCHIPTFRPGLPGIHPGARAKKKTTDAGGVINQTDCPTTQGGEKAKGEGDQDIKTEENIELILNGLKSLSVNDRLLNLPSSDGKGVPLKDLIKQVMKEVNREAEQEQNSFDPNAQTFVPGTGQLNLAQELETEGRWKEQFGPKQWGNMIHYPWDTHVIPRDPSIVPPDSVKGAGQGDGHYQNVNQYVSNQQHVINHQNANNHQNIINPPPPENRKQRKPPTTGNPDKPTSSIYNIETYAQLQEHRLRKAQAAAGNNVVTGNNAQWGNNVPLTNNVQVGNNVPVANFTSPANNVPQRNNIPPANNVQPRNNVLNPNNAIPRNNVQPVNDVQLGINAQNPRNVQPINNVNPINNVHPVGLAAGNYVGQPGSLQAAIAEAVRVSTMTITQDQRDMNCMTKLASLRPKKLFDKGAEGIDFEIHLTRYMAVMNQCGATDDMRITEMAHWFTGASYETIERCILNEDMDQAVSSALRELRDRFGQRSETAEEMLYVHMTKGPLSAHDHNGIMDFIAQIGNLYHLAVITDRKGEFDRKVTLSTLLRARLPFWYTQWVKKYNKNEQDGNARLEFTDLLKFLELKRKEAVEINSPTFQGFGAINYNNNNSFQSTTSSKKSYWALKKAEKKNVQLYACEAAAPGGVVNAVDGGPNVPKVGGKGGEKKEGKEVGKKGPCAYCQGKNHSVLVCSKLQALPPAERRKEGAERNLCFRCGRPDHKAAKCPNKATMPSCSKCSKNHHAVFCDPSFAGAQAPQI